MVGPIPTGLAPSYPPPYPRAEEKYLEELQRELYADVVGGQIKSEEVIPILTGAQEYLRLRRRLNAFLLRFRSKSKRWWSKLFPFTVKRTLSPEDIRERFFYYGYVCDEPIAEAVHLSLVLEKPLLVEGEPGVGKTEIAKVLAQVLQADLIRLQCYEGLDENKALYEWNYQKQLLYIQGGKEVQDIFSEEFLLPRPLLKAITNDKPTVLLIDEIDKADEEFEAMLLEILSDFQISIPELGTIKARRKPHVIITNNDTRDLSDALVRRCVYLYIDYPTVEKEEAILLKKVKGLSPLMAREIALLMHNLKGWRACGKIF